MKIYGDIGSGNCYQVKLLCALTQLEHEWLHIDILAGDTQTAEFLSKNPNGKIPLLELDDGRVLPNDGFERARVLQWQFSGRRYTDHRRYQPLWLHPRRP